MDCPRPCFGHTFTHTQSNPLGPSATCARNTYAVFSSSAKHIRHIRSQFSVSAIGRSMAHRLHSAPAASQIRYRIRFDGSRPTRRYIHSSTDSHNYIYIGSRTANHIFFRQQSCIQRPDIQTHISVAVRVFARACSRSMVAFRIQNQKYGNIKNTQSRAKPVERLRHRIHHAPPLALARSYYMPMGLLLHTDVGGILCFSLYSCNSRTTRSDSSTRDIRTIKYSDGSAFKRRDRTVAMGSDIRSKPIRTRSHTGKRLRQCSAWHPNSYGNSIRHIHLRGNSSRQEPKDKEIQTRK